jgi:hypothetical protein
VEWLTPQLILSIGTLIGVIMAAIQSFRNGVATKAVADNAVITTAKTNEKLEVIHTNTNSSLDKLNKRLDDALLEAKNAREENKALRSDFSDFVKAASARETIGSQVSDAVKSAMVAQGAAKNDPKAK